MTSTSAARTGEKGPTAEAKVPTVTQQLLPPPGLHPLQLLQLGLSRLASSSL